MIHLALAAAFAVLGPRLLGLVEPGTPLVQHALWGALFGGIGGMAGALLPRGSRRTT